jgi:DNA-binding XRE family transcriptional regulator
MKRRTTQIIFAVFLLGLTASGCATFYTVGVGAAADLSQPENIDYSLAALEGERPEENLIITLDDARFFECTLQDIKFKDSSLFNEEMQIFIDNHPEINPLPSYADEISVISIEGIKTHWELIALERNYIRVRKPNDSLKTVIFYKHFDYLTFGDEMFYKDDLKSIVESVDFPAYTFLEIEINPKPVSIAANKIVRIKIDNKPHTGKITGLIFGIALDAYFIWLTIQAIARMR